MKELPQRTENALLSVGQCQWIGLQLWVSLESDPRRKVDMEHPHRSDGYPIGSEIAFEVGVARLPS